jgi:type II secretory ATPase GspE/PulE/Tfp pilus assembly ATPase PilB-like protein
MSNFSLSQFRLWNAPAQNEKRHVIDQRLRQLFPRSEMLRCHCVAMRFENNVLHVATDQEHVALTESFVSSQVHDPRVQQMLGVRGPFAWRVETVSKREIDQMLQKVVKTTTTTELQIDPAIAALLPLEYARSYRILLCHVIGTQVVFAVESNDGRKMAEQLLEQTELGRRIAQLSYANEQFTSKLRPSIQIVPHGVIDEYFKQIYGIDLSFKEKIAEAAEKLRDTVRDNGRGPNLRFEPGSKNDIETMLTSILGRLKEDRYSDLRISYDFDAGQIDFSARQNGYYETIERITLPNEIFGRLAQWIFTAADIATPLSEPADGSITFRQVMLPGSRRQEDITVRMSYLPLLDPRHRQAICNGRFSFRIINDGEHFMSLDELGYTPTEMNDIGKILRLRNGLILLVGEMGSGKSATANALLARKSENERGVDMVSLERPVEYRNPYISQVELKPDGAADEKTSPLRYLKTLVRQGTNGVFLGEIGEGEMAQMVTTMALTGVYVVSTFHATNPFTAMYRLSKPPFLVSPHDLAAMTGAIIHQCLVSQNCPTCAQPDEEWRETLDQLDHTGQTRQLIERYIQEQGWIEDVNRAYSHAVARYAEHQWDRISQKLRYDTVGQINRPTGDPEACFVMYRAVGEVILPFEMFESWVREQGGRLWQPKASKGILQPGQSCPDCVGKGKKPGVARRTAIPEIWIPTEKERLMIEREGLSPLSLRNTAMQRGHRTRFMAALERVADGTLSLRNMIQQMGLPGETDLFVLHEPAEPTGRSGQKTHDVRREYPDTEESEIIDAVWEED